MNSIARRWASHPVLAVLLIAALGWRALIPAGFMPAFSEGRTLTVQLCSTRGNQATTLHLQGNEQSTPAGAQGAETCPYASVGSSAPPPSFVSIAQFSSLLSESVAAPPGRLLTRPEARAHSPRGPPVFAGNLRTGRANAVSLIA